MVLPYLRNRCVNGVASEFVIQQANLYILTRLQVESTRAILCVGEWCKKGIIKDKDILAALKGIPEDVEEDALEEGWDRIST